MAIEKIAILSDTHIPSQGDEIPFDVLKKIEGVGLIVHAGDFAICSVLDRLKSIAPVKAVKGNMDDEELCATLPSVEYFELGGLSWGLTHGNGEPVGIIGRVQAVFSPFLPDIVVFGHTHQPLIERLHGTIFFNPGSPTDMMYAPYRSCGFIELESGSVIRLEIVRV